MIADAIRTAKRAIIPYVTAGLPDLDVTGEIIEILSESGAAAIEIGIPFSDPMADGPTLQKASNMALQSGFSLEAFLSRLDKWSTEVKTPLIIMSYINPIMRRGMRETLSMFRDSGIEGVIIPDLPLDGREINGLCKEVGIDLIRLVAPTTPEARQKEVVSQCGGFVYAVAVKGVTGARASLPTEIRQQVEGLKTITDLPVCVGFGVSDARQVTDLLAFADGVIVGSHLMGRLMDSSNPVRAVSEAFTALMKEEPAFIA